MTDDTGRQGDRWIQPMKEAQAMTMSKSERTELARVVRQRAKVARSGIEARKAELLADFEDQLAAEYDFDDAAWAAITAGARRAVGEADAQIAAICEDVGIPAEFRPGLEIGWYTRGKNAVAQKRAELRKVAVTRLDALGKAAKMQIDRAELEACEELVAGGLESEQAREWLARLPTVEALMPRISVPEIEVYRNASRPTLSAEERYALPHWDPGVCEG